MKTGGCQCGAIRFELSGEPVTVYACHCLECRKQSASAFGISTIYSRADLHVTLGKPKQWNRPTDSGGTMTCWFCEVCGSRLWHEGGGSISVKGGALDETLEPRSHIWTAHKLPWVILPDGIETWPYEPED